MKLTTASSGRPDGSPARILLVDDNDVLRRGLAQMLLREPDFTVAGEASSSSEALALMASLAPDLAMVDMGLRNGDSLALVRTMRRRRPGFPVLLLTRRDDDRQTERALRAGARGLVSKWATAHTVAAVVRTALQGGILVATRSAGATAPLTAEHSAEPGAAEYSPKLPNLSHIRRVLTPRETEVFTLLGRGNDLEEIAAQLRLSLKTVEVYLSNARRKLDLPSFLALHCCAHDFCGQDPAVGPDEGRV